MKHPGKKIFMTARRKPSRKMFVIGELDPRTLSVEQRREEVTDILRAMITKGIGGEFMDWVKVKITDIMFSEAPSAEDIEWLRGLRRKYL
jgi:hypothetical protein